MCGRARLPDDYSEIKIQLGLPDFAPAPNWRPSWNIAPTQDMFTVVRNSEPAARIPQIVRWGLNPSWSKEPKMKYATFGLRSLCVHPIRRHGLADAIAEFAWVVTHPSPPTR